MLRCRASAIKMKTHKKPTGNCIKRIKNIVIFFLLTSNDFLMS